MSILFRGPALVCLRLEMQFCALAPDIRGATPHQLRYSLGAQLASLKTFQELDVIERHCLAAAKVELKRLISNRLFSSMELCGNL
ncbi:MAG TPA: hypothetical protein VGR47_10155 [Terracidiphilus sp.]|nr:hypothetical protein [Terracidiphilus sp.]